MAAAQCRRAKRSTFDDRDNRAIQCPNRISSCLCAMSANGRVAELRPSALPVRYRRQPPILESKQLCCKRCSQATALSSRFAA